MRTFESEMGSFQFLNVQLCCLTQMHVPERERVEVNLWLCCFQKTSLGSFFIGVCSSSWNQILAFFNWCLVDI